MADEREITFAGIKKGCAILKNMVRKILKSIFIFVCMLSMMVMVMPESVMPVQAATKKVKKFYYENESCLNSIKLKWKKQSGVSYYAIYRVDATKYVLKESNPKKSKYKKIDTVTSNANKYTDNSVKKGRYYSYIIQGYAKKAGKDKLICSTFEEYYLNYNMAGLTTPEIQNAGYGEGYHNSAKKLYLYAREDCGMEPTGYVFYRKEVGGKSYKKIGTKNGEKDVFVDNSVKGGKTYRYKVKSYLKIGEKTYYSKKSKYIQMSAVNFTCSYKVKALSNPSGNSNTISWKLKSNKKYNGDTVIKPGDGSYQYRKNKNSDILIYDCAMKKYSLDNKTWIDIPKKGIILKAKQTIYLQCELSENDELSNGEKASDINFVSDTLCESQIEFMTGGIEYKGSYFCATDYTEATLNFVTGHGSAYLEWD
ncbi:MAG: hypothetical protein ACLRZ9_05240 [Eubacterium sp.]